MAENVRSASNQTPAIEKLVSRSTGNTLREKLDSLLLETELHRGSRVRFQRERPAHVVATRLTDTEHADLTELRTLVSETTLSGVVLHALAVYASIVEHISRGREIRVLEANE